MVLDKSNRFKRGIIKGLFINDVLIYGKSNFKVQFLLKKVSFCFLKPHRGLTTKFEFAPFEHPIHLKLCVNETDRP